MGVSVELYDTENKAKAAALAHTNNGGEAKVFGPSQDWVAVFDQSANPPAEKAVVAGNYWVAVLG